MREHLLAVQVLEDLVEAIFAASLRTVSNERGRPAEEDTAEALSPVD